jgi:hypothetical protein
VPTCMRLILKFMPINRPRVANITTHQAIVGVCIRGSAALVKMNISLMAGIFITAQAATVVSPKPRAIQLYTRRMKALTRARVWSAE